MTIEPTRMRQPKQALKRSEIEQAQRFIRRRLSIFHRRPIAGRIRTEAKQESTPHTLLRGRRSPVFMVSRIEGNAARTKRNDHKRERWGRTEALFRASPVERYRGHCYMAASEYRSDQSRQERWFHRFGFRSLVLPSHSPPSAVSLRRLVSSTERLPGINLSPLPSPSRL